MSPKSRWAEKARQIKGERLAMPAAFLSSASGWSKRGMLMHLELGLMRIDVICYNDGASMCMREFGWEIRAAAAELEMTYFPIQIANLRSAAVTDELTNPFVYIERENVSVSTVNTV